MSNGSKTARFGALRWLGAVRVRAALASLVIVGIAFTFSAFGVIALLRNSLYQSDTNTAQAEALDISSFVTKRSLVPTYLPISAAATAAQVVSRQGEIITSSRNISGQGPMVDLSPPATKVATALGVVLHTRRFTHVNLDLDHRFVVAAVGFKSSGFSGTVLVADSLGSADHAIGLVERSLGIALPLLALLVAALVFVLTGWSLLPVEVIRSEVSELSATDLRRRVPEPTVRDEIGLLARTMNEMLGRLEASSDRQRQLVADVSHELRNPLASLRTQLEVAAAHPGVARMSMLEGSIVEVNRMSQLVEDLLTLARLDEGTLRLRPSEVDLDDLLLVHADRLRTHGKIAVSVKGVTAARIHGDATQLSRVIANLADNAERYAARQVELAITRRETTYELSVCDDGPGVVSFERERIFERFVRLDSARAHDGTGAGLGLAIVREIVLAHNGDVWVEDAAPGARFIVRLPHPKPSDFSFMRPLEQRERPRSAEVTPQVGIDRR